MKRQTLAIMFLGLTVLPAIAGDSASHEGSQSDQFYNADRTLNTNTLASILHDAAPCTSANYVLEAYPLGSASWRWLTLGGVGAGGIRFGWYRGTGDRPDYVDVFALGISPRPVALLDPTVAGIAQGLELVLNALRESENPYLTSGDDQVDGESEAGSTWGDETGSPALSAVSDQ